MRRSHEVISISCGGRQAKTYWLEQQAFHFNERHGEHEYRPQEAVIHRPPNLLGTLDQGFRPEPRPLFTY